MSTETDLAPAKQAGRLRLDATTVFDLLDEPISIFALDGTYEYINKAGLALLGKTEAELIGRRYFEFAAQLSGWFSGDLSTHPFHRAFQRVASGESPIEWLEIQSQPTGQATATWAQHRLHRAREHVIVNWRDITARRRDELQQQESSARAAEGERQFRAMVEGMPQLAWHARADGFIDYFNPRWYQYTGTTPEQMEGWGWQAVHDPAVLPRVIKEWTRSIATGEPFEMEFPLRRHDGRFRSFLTRVQPMRDEEGKVVRWIGINADIQDQKSAREAVEGARVEAEQANRTKDEFLAMLSHELRNPLAPILTALELMRLRGDAASERERGVIERQVKHLVRLVNDLLDVSRITRGAVELAREQVDLAEIVAKATEMASPLLEQGNHTLTTKVPKDGLVISGDPARLSQVLANLLANAAKYTPAGGSVTVSAAREGAEVVLRVRDTGVGIPAELLPHVFDLFVQNRQTLERSQGGLGLGLSIVRSLVAAHGGAVTAESGGAGRGSTFTVRLPAAEGAPPQPRIADAVRAARAQRATKVLVVDDNEDAAEVLSQTLQHLGYTVRAAHDGPSALAALAFFQPDVALLDIGLPVMDGYELARRLRDLPELAGLRLVAITGYGQESDRERAQLAGFDEHLTKPVSLDQLAAVLSRKP